jgi:EpsI family protein
VWAVGLGAAVIAYRDLLWYAPKRSLSDEIEQLFFMPSQSVAPLVVLLAAWLLYRRAARLRSLPAARAPWLGATCLGAGALVHLWATLSNAPDLLAPSLGLVVCGVAALWKGRNAARVVLLPALFLLFAMPLPAPLVGEVVFRLQLWTADLAGVLLGMLGIPHHVAGDQILGTHQTYAVIETCSGLRSIETLTMVAILMADLFGRRGAHALLLVVAAPPLAFFLNGWRAVALILNPYSELATVHNAQGIAMLLGGLVLLSLLDGLAEKVGRRLGAGRGEGDASSRRDDSQDERTDAPRTASVAAASVLCALAVASLAYTPVDPISPEPLRLDSGLGNLPAQELPTDRLFLGSAGFREVTTQRFQRNGHDIDVFLGVGWRPGRARSARSPKSALPGSGWILEDEQIRRLGPDDRAVRQLVLRSGTQAMLVYHWYEGDAGLALETIRSLLALDSSPLRRQDDILAVRMATPIEGPVATGLETAAARLDGFYATLRDEIDRLPGRRRVRGPDGTAFLDFPVWENFFHPTGSATSRDRESIQVFGVETAPGIRLAKQRVRDEEWALSSGKV